MHEDRRHEPPPLPGADARRPGGAEAQQHRVVFRAAGELLGDVDRGRHDREQHDHPRGAAEPAVLHVDVDGRPGRRRARTARLGARAEARGILLRDDAERALALARVDHEERPAAAVDAGGDDALRLEEKGQLVGEPVRQRTQERGRRVAHAGVRSPAKSDSAVISEGTGSSRHCSTVGPMSASTPRGRKRRVPLASCT